MMLPTILKYRIRQYYNSFSRTSARKKLGWLISIAFIIPYYSIIINTMRLLYINLYRAMGWQATARTFSFNLAMIFFFVLISASALTLYRLFQSHDLPLLMSLPLNDRSLFQAKFMEALEDVGRSMILPLPVCIAFASVLYEIGLSYNALLLFIGIIGIAIQLGSLSIIITLILGKIISAKRGAVISRIVAILASLMIIVIFMSYIQRVNLNNVLMSSDGLGILSKFLPTSWLIGFLPSGSSSILPCVLYGLIFALVTLTLLIATFCVFKMRFRPMWTDMTEKRPRRKIQRINSKRTEPMSSIRALMLKDIYITKREPSIWIGLLVPLILFPIFIFFKDDIPKTQSFYMFFVSLLTTASFTISSIGREGRGFSLIRSMPVKVSVVLRAKFILSFTATLAVTCFFSLTLFFIRKSSLNQTWNNLAMAFIFSGYFSAFGTALAGIFPKFDFTNPMRAVSMPGMLTLYAIGALFSFTFILILATKWYFIPLVLIPWTGVAIVLLLITERKLEKMDM